MLLWFQINIGIIQEIKTLHHDTPSLYLSSSEKPLTEDSQGSPYHNSQQFVTVFSTL